MNYPIKKITKGIKGEDVERYIIVGQQGQAINNIYTRTKEEAERYRDILKAVLYAS